MPLRLASPFRQAVISNHIPRPTPHARRPTPHGAVGPRPTAHAPRPILSPVSPPTGSCDPVGGSRRRRRVTPDADAAHATLSIGVQLGRAEFGLPDPVPACSAVCWVQSLRRSSKATVTTMPCGVYAGLRSQYARWRRPPRESSIGREMMLVNSGVKNNS